MGISKHFLYHHSYLFNFSIQSFNISMTSGGPQVLLKVIQQVSRRSSFQGLEL